MILRDTNPGFSLIELTFVVALAALGTTLAATTCFTIAERSALTTAKRKLTLAMLEARRLAYVNDETATVHVAPGSAFVTVTTPRGKRTHDLGDVEVIAAPARRQVSFKPSGTADNATVVLARPGGAVSTELVVNQRGMLR